MALRLAKMAQKWTYKLYELADEAVWRLEKRRWSR